MIPLKKNKQIYEKCKLLCLTVPLGVNNLVQKYFINLVNCFNRSMTNVNQSKTVVCQYLIYLLNFGLFMQSYLSNLIRSYR